MSAETRMGPSPIPQPARKGRLLTGYILTALAAFFLVFDAWGKLVMPPAVAQAFVRLGFPARLSVDLGVVMLVCTALYLIPKTAVLGATLLTAYLGGAVAIQMRAGSPVFETVFPVIFGVMVWAGILLREDRLLVVFPLRCPRCPE